MYAYLTCPKLKIEHQKSLGLMQSLSILKRKLDKISMDLMTSLSRTKKGCDSIWVIVDKRTKLARIISIIISYPL